jgi:hypothetical protein
MKLHNLLIEIERENIIGGVGDNSLASSVNQDELLVGIAVEMEHTDDKGKAMDIAVDHLVEVPNYYSKLVKSGLVDEPNAIELYNKYLRNEISKLSNK